jgi:hypothetical protein
MQMRTIKKYLEKLEAAVKLPGELGWENFLNKDKTRTIWPVTAFAFWTTLSVLTIIVPTLLKGV